MGSDKTRPTSAGLGRPTSEGELQNGFRIAKSTQEKRKRDHWSSASQNTKPITDFFGAKNGKSISGSAPSSGGGVSQPGGRVQLNTAAAEKGRETDASAQRPVESRGKTASPQGKQQMKESSKGKALGKFGKAATLPQGQMRLAFVPPRRIEGGGPGRDNAGSQWALKRPQPTEVAPVAEPQPHVPASSGPAMGKKCISAHAEGEVLSPERRLGSAASNQRRALNRPTTYQAFGAPSGSAADNVSAKTFRTSFDVSEHVEREDEVLHKQPVAASVRRACENLSGRTGEMPFVEELPKSGSGSQVALHNGQQSVEEASGSWQAFGARFNRDLASRHAGEGSQATPGDGQQVDATPSPAGGVVRPSMAHEPRPVAPLLSAEQRLAATSSFNTPLMIIAGAGTGKTQTMAVRVVEMLRNDIPPQKILPLSFTNKAASELEERIARIYHATLAADKPGIDLSKLTVSTFHSLGLRWLRIYHRALGFAKMPTVYEKRQKEQVVARCIELYKREDDRRHACTHLELNKETPWRQIFARWSQISPETYRRCEEAVRKRLEEVRRKRKKKREAEEKKKKVARTESGAGGRGRGRTGRGRGRPGSAGRGPGIQGLWPQRAENGGAASRGTEPSAWEETSEVSGQGGESEGGAGAAEEEESDVTEWENELAEEVYREIWTVQLLKNVPHSQEKLDGIWKERWKGLESTKDIVKKIERAKTYGYAASQYGKGIFWSDVYQLYEKKMREVNAVDFDDMLRLLGLLLDGETCRAAKRRFQSQFKYILVDEYQDTNSVQSKIVQNFYESMHESCITVVGDDDQSIYGFRGANSRAFTLFMSHFFAPGRGEKALLQENYRSTGNILKVGAEVIRENTERVAKTLRPTKEQGDPVQVVQAGTEEDEAAWIADKIAETMAEEGSTRHFRDFALLLRNFKFGPQGSVSVVFQKALQRRKIPFKLTGGQSIYERAEVQDVMAYLSLILDEDNDTAFERVCNKPPRAMNPAKDKSQCMTVLRAVQGQLENRAQNRGPPSLMAAAKTALRRGDIDGKHAENVRGFVEQIEALRDYATCHSAGDTIRAVLKRTGYSAYAKKQRDKERRKSREQAGRKGAREESFDSDDEAAMEGGCVPEDDVAGLDDEEEEEEGGAEEGGGAAEPERGGGGEREGERSKGPEAKEAAEEKEMGSVLAGFVKEAEHFTGQWTSGVPPDANDGVPSLYTLCQLKVYEYALAGAYDPRELREGLPGSIADDIFATRRLGRLVLQDFVAAIALQKEENATAEAERDAVTISTIHRAKGLEWPNVFVPRWNQGFFPSEFRRDNFPIPDGTAEPPGKDEAGHLEEERRLAHVACTRAKDRLYLTYIRILTKLKKPEELVKSSFSLPADKSVCCEIQLEESQNERAAKFRMNRDESAMEYIGFVSARGFLS